MSLLAYLFQPGVLTAIVFGVCTIIGIVAIPAVVTILGKSFPRPLRAIMGRILFTVGALINGRSVLDMRDSGHYEIHPLAKRGDSWAFKREGEWESIDDEASNWFRLGKTPFGMVWEHSDRAVREYSVDNAGATDGGFRQITRGDGHVGIEETGPVEGFRIRIGTLTERLRDAAGIDIYQRGIDRALEEFDGNKPMSQKMLIAAIAFALVAGFASGYILIA